MRGTDEEKLMSVVKSLKEAGYHPQDQIYITRHGNAREIIKTINKDVLRKYVEKK